SLASNQVDKTSSVVLLGEKWDRDATGAVVGETWLEGWDGDMNEDPLRPGHMKEFADRHANAMNATFFDGHAKKVRPSQLWNSPWMNGCALVHFYPTSRMCDTSFPTCIRTAPTNLCNKWATANPYPDL
ncbi:MAG: hypothetical protein ABUL49_02150, partial [bacterium]